MRSHMAGCKSYLNRKYQYNVFDMKQAAYGIHKVLLIPSQASFDVCVAVGKHLDITH